MTKSSCLLFFEWYKIILGHVSSFQYLFKVTVQKCDAHLYQTPLVDLLAQSLRAMFHLKNLDLFNSKNIRKMKINSFCFQEGIHSHLSSKSLVLGFEIG